MNREKAREILGENATEEMITNLLNNYHVEESTKIKELESKVNTLTEAQSKYSDYDEIKSKLEEINKASMTEQEKIEAMKKETEKNLAQSRIIVNTAKAKNILSGLDLDDDTIAMLVSDDETKTINNATKLKAKFDSVKETVKKETTENLSNLNLKPNMDNAVLNADKVMTKEKFDKLPMHEQKAWKNENLEKYREFYPLNDE